MKFLIEKLPTLICVSILSVFLIISGLLFLNINIKTTLENWVYNTLDEVLAQQAYNFTSKLHDEKIVISSIAKTIAHNHNPYNISIAELNVLAKDTNFEFLAIADKDGNTINNDYIEDNVQELDFFRQSITGRTFVSDPFDAKQKNIPIVVVSAPLVNDSQIIGVLFGAFKASKLNELLLSSFKGKGYVYVTTGNGEFVAGSVNEYSLLADEKNLFNHWRKVTFYENDNFMQMLNNLNQDKQGYAKYKYANERRLASYAKLGVNNWNIFSVVPEDVISEFSKKITYQIYVMSISLVFICCGLLFWIIKLQLGHIQKVEDIAFVDSLTGIPTLAKFKLDATKILEENPDTTFIIIKFDIDRFKIINKTMGYQEGDKVIVNVAKSLSKMFQGKKQAIARTHIDEFVILTEYETLEGILTLRSIFIKDFFNLMGDSFNYNIKFPAGYYVYEAASNQEDAINHDIAVLLEKVNSAHRKCKQKGLEYFIYDEEIIMEDIKKKEIENKMTAALANQEFKVYLQPKYYLSTETISGAEALVRWQTAQETISPANFIPIFEENGFITKLDMYMFEQVCALLSGWIREGLMPITVSVNFARHHINNNSFVQNLCDITDKYNVPRHLLEIELTESTMFDNEDILIKVLEELHAANFSLSMDDFGTGYSSLGLLKNIPVDVIKIDKSFFTSSKNPYRLETVIANIIKMAGELGIDTVAEGVESKEQVELLRKLKCDIVQGYYYARPMPVTDFTNMLKKG